MHVYRCGWVRIALSVRVAQPTPGLSVLWPRGSTKIASSRSCCSDRFLCIKEANAIILHLLLYMFKARDVETDRILLLL